MSTIRPHIITALPGEPTLRFFISTTAIRVVSSISQSSIWRSNQDLACWWLFRRVPILNMVCEVFAEAPGTQCPVGSPTTLHVGCPPKCQIENRLTYVPPYSGCNSLYNTLRALNSGSPMKITVSRGAPDPCLVGVREFLWIDMAYEQTWISPAKSRINEKR